VKDTWENYELIKRRFDERFSVWTQSISA